MFTSCEATRPVVAMSDHVKTLKIGSGVTMPAIQKLHNHGIPWILVHSESFANRSQAMRKEHYYKTGRGREELDRLIG